MIESVFAVVGGFALWLGVSSLLAFLMRTAEHAAMARRVRLTERRNVQG